MFDLPLEMLVHSLGLCGCNALNFVAYLEILALTQIFKL